MLRIHENIYNENNLSVICMYCIVEYLYGIIECNINGVKNKFNTCWHMETI